MIKLVLALAVAAAVPAAAQTASPAAAPTQRTVPDATPQGTWLIEDVTVIPVDTDEVLAHRSVLVRDGRIAAITAASRPPRAAGATRIDGRGKYLVPGFVDAHVHIATEGALRDSKNPALANLDMGSQHAYDQQVLLTFLKAGVTGAANLGGGPRSDEDLLWLRDEVAAGRLSGPTLYVGKRINGPRAEVAKERTTPPPASRVESPTTAADGIAAVRAARERGYDFIKPYQFLNRETYQAIVEEARRQNFITTGHLPELGCAVCADRAFAFDHPLTNIAHTEELARYGRESDFAPADIDALASLVADRKISVTPTLVTLKTIVHMYVNRDVPTVPDAWRALVDPMTRRDWVLPHNRYLTQAFRDQDGADTFPAGYDFARVLTRQLWKRGVPLTVGTDAPLPGLVFGESVHREMIELRGVGLPPIEVLRAASINAHRLFDPSNGTGAVREGERANLVLLDANPLSDIHNVSQVAGVFAQGRWLTSAQIDARLAQLGASDDELSQRIEAASAPAK